MCKFKLYLERHVELDGDIHSHLAKKLVASICKSEMDWTLAEKSALDAIQSRLLMKINLLLCRYQMNNSIFRLKYWDGVCDVINSKALCTKICKGYSGNCDIEDVKKCVINSPEKGS